MRFAGSYCRVLLGLCALVLCVPVGSAAETVTAVLAPIDWPLESALKRAQGQRQALLFVNPYDFEARKFLVQAQEVSARSGAPFTVCFAGPPQADDRWYDTPLVGTARRLGFAVYFDSGAQEATRFGAATSGVCAAYDARGRLCFYGDIAPTAPGYTKEEGLKAAIQGLSRVRGRSDHLYLGPITGGALLPPAAAQRGTPEP